jgi:hypothetical protein
VRVYRTHEGQYFVKKRATVGQSAEPSVVMKIASGGEYMLEVKKVRKGRIKAKKWWRVLPMCCSCSSWVNLIQANAPAISSDRFRTQHPIQDSLLLPKPPVEPIGRTMKARSNSWFVRNASDVSTVMINTIFGIHPVPNHTTKPTLPISHFSLLNVSISILKICRSDDVIEPLWLSRRSCCFGKGCFSPSSYASEVPSGK